MLVVLVLAVPLLTQHSCSNSSSSNNSNRCQPLRCTDKQQQLQRDPRRGWPGRLICQLQPRTVLRPLVLLLRRVLRVYRRRQQYVLVCGSARQARRL